MKFDDLLKIKCPTIYARRFAPTKPTDTERLEAVEAAVGELAAMLVAAEAKEAKPDA